MNCRTRLMHKPAAEEAETERAEWQARCGWPYGVRQFFRLHDLPPNPSLCRRCFPDTPVDLEAPEAVSSSDSSSSTSGATLGVRLIVAGSGQPNISTGAPPDQFC